MTPDKIRGYLEMQRPEGKSLAHGGTKGETLEERTATDKRLQLTE